MTAMDELLMTAAVARLETRGAGAYGLGAAVVVGDDFTPESFVRGAIDFAAGVPLGDKAAWHRSFTRTVFLAGRPESVRTRHPARVETGGLAWYGPAPMSGLRNLSRLLKAFHGPAPVDVPASVLIPGDAHVVEAAVAVGAVSVRDYLVHVHHLFAEAALRGLVRAGDTVRIMHRPELDGPRIRAALDPACAGVVQTRITHDNREPGRLRLYAVLTSDREGGQPCRLNAS
jgi:Family of unknown function (DUF6182)